MVSWLWERDLWLYQCQTLPVPSLTFYAYCTQGGYTLCPLQRTKQQPHILEGEGMRFIKDFYHCMWEYYLPGLRCLSKQQVKIKTETIIAKLQIMISDYHLLTFMPFHHPLPHCEPFNNEYCMR